MKNLTIKIAAAAILAGGLLAPARAEIAIGTSLEGYVPSAATRGALARAARLESLEAAAQSVAAGAERGEGEALLASMYTGKAPESAAPVYAEPAAARAVSAAPGKKASPRPVPAVKRAAAEKSAIEELGEAAGADTPEAGAPAAADDEAPAAVDADAASDDEGKPTLGGMLLASAISFLVIMFFILLLI